VRHHLKNILLAKVPVAEVLFVEADFENFAHHVDLFGANKSNFTLLTELSGQKTEGDEDHLGVSSITSKAAEQLAEIV